MVRIINFNWLFRGVAVATAILSITIYEIIRRNWITDLPVVKVVSIAPSVALIVVLLLTTAWSARFIWKILKVCNGSLFPDLNGTWEGEIVTENNLTIPARASIRQSLLQTLIDLHTET